MAATIGAVRNNNSQFSETGPVENIPLTGEVTELNQLRARDSRSPIAWILMIGIGPGPMPGQTDVRLAPQAANADLVNHFKL
jgi:hypothetical protein